MSDRKKDRPELPAASSPRSRPKLLTPDFFRTKLVQADTRKSTNQRQASEEVEMATAAVMRYSSPSTSPSQDKRREGQWQGEGQGECSQRFQSRASAVASSPTPSSKTRSNPVAEAALRRAEQNKNAAPLRTQVPQLSITRGVENKGNWSDWTLNDLDDHYSQIPTTKAFVDTNIPVDPIYTTAFTPIIENFTFSTQPVTVEVVTHKGDDVMVDDGDVMVDRVDRNGGVPVAVKSECSEETDIQCITDEVMADLLQRDEYSRELAMSNASSDLEMAKCLQEEEDTQSAINIQEDGHDSSYPSATGQNSVKKSFLFKAAVKESSHSAMSHASGACGIGPGIPLGQSTGQTALQSSGHTSVVTSGHGPVATRGQMTTSGHGPVAARGQMTTSGHGPVAARGQKTTSGHGPVAARGQITSPVTSGRHLRQVDSMNIARESEQIVPPVLSAPPNTVSVHSRIHLGPEADHSTVTAQPLQDETPSIDMSYEALLRLEDVHHGISEEYLPQFTNTQSYRDTDGTSADSKKCAVCLLDFRPGHMLRNLPCLHSFHCHCIDQWLQHNSTCPICMKDIRELMTSTT